jgi:hypothetical protein
VARLFADENFPLPAIEELRRLGHEILTAKDAGMKDLSIPDEGVLLFAKENQLAVLTLNRVDFIQLHKKDSNHHGIIVCTSDKIFLALAQRVHHALSTAGELRGQLIRVYRPSR